MLIENGLSKAGIEINRKVLSEMAINDEKAFAKLVEISTNALNGKSPKKNETKVEKEEKQTTDKKESKTDYSAMTLAELKNIAKEKGIKGYSSMKKDELLANLK